MLTCKTPMQEVGRIKEGEFATLNYVIENTSDRSYAIVPWSSCGCSTPTIPKGIIEPNEKIIMELKFDTMGKVGMNEKSFGLWYGDKQRLNLKFKAEVVKS